MIAVISNSFFIQYAHAQSGIPAPVAKASNQSADSDGLTRTLSYSLRQLGAINSMNLRGVDGRDTVKFNIRTDEVISSAALKLSYAFSPALLDDASQLNILINGDVAASIPLDQGQGGNNIERTVSLPIKLITDYNLLTLQLIGRSSMQCEDPTNTALWANISNRSVLELTTQKIILPNDLTLLPVPFMDPRDPHPLELPFVFSGIVSNGSLEAAGMVSSWFGALAGSRGARFPVSLNTIPYKGNAVVILQGRPNIPGVQLPPLSGGMVSVITNPNDRFGKLLLVMGRDPAELKRAASALTLGQKTLSGQSSSITTLQTLSPRKPYDAPNWIPSDRAVKFGELTTTKSLNVSGYDPGPIRINMRVPPDLYSWKDSGVPVQLNYRYTPQPNSKNSSLTVTINNQLLKTFPLYPIDRLTQDHSLLGQARSLFAVDGMLLDRVQTDETLPLTGKLRIPLTMLYPRSQLQLRYMYDYVKSGECGEIIIDNVLGAIETDSTLDISGFSHFISMPDLRVFHTSGFPFTRMADLSQTAVILPDAPSLQEYATFLEVLGRLGDSSGYPATSVVVTQGSKITAVADKDLLLIASGVNQPLLKQWASSLPASLGGTQRFSISDLVYKTRNLWSADPQDNEKHARSEITFSSVSDGALIAGFESPLKSGRSAVLIWGAEAQGLRDSVSALIGGDDYERTVEGSLVRIRAMQVDPLVSEQTYQVGRLGVLDRIQWILSRNLWLFMLCAMVSALLLAMVAYVFLRALARRRTLLAEGSSSNADL